MRSVELPVCLVQLLGLGRNHWSLRIKGRGLRELTVSPTRGHCDMFGKLEKGARKEGTCWVDLGHRILLWSVQWPAGQGLPTPSPSSRGRSQRNRPIFKITWEIVPPQQGAQARTESKNHIVLGLEVTAKIIRCICFTLGCLENPLDVRTSNSGLLI